MATTGPGFTEALDRFSVAENGCWIWEGPRNQDGYGRITVGSVKEGGRRTVDVHRLMYELLKGPVPEKLELDHLCKTRECVNPDHLEPVPHQVNSARAHTHCKNGHLIAGDNLLMHSGARRCKTCRYAYNRAYEKRSRSRKAHKYKARNAVNSAIRARRFVRQPCEICGAKAQAHHEDYFRPLEIRWLCVKHHRAQEKPNIKRKTQQELRAAHNAALKRWRARRKSLLLNEGLLRPSFVLV